MYVVLHVAGKIDPEVLEWREGDDSEQLTPLMAAVLGGHTQIADLLLSAGANVSARNASGRSAQEMAWVSGDRSLMDAFEAAARLQAVYDGADGDGDGKMDHKELMAMMRARGRHLSDDEAKALLAAMDGDGDGVIDRSEFTRDQDKLFTGLDGVLMS